MAFQHKSPTLRQIAEKASVSPMTVSLALRNSPNLSTATRERVCALAEKMGYRVNPLVSVLMSHVRSTKKVSYVATLGMITEFPTRDGWKAHHAPRRSAEGALQRARQLGYELDEFWIREDGMTPARFTKMLLTRGIHGLVIPGLNDPGGTLDLDFSQFASAAMGYTLARPGLHRAVNNQFASMRLAIDTLAERGYERVGLAISDEMERRSNDTWLGALLAGQQRFSAKHRVRPLIASPLERAGVDKWIASQKPDVIIGVDEPLRAWVEKSETSSGKHLGFVHLDWSEQLGDVAGIDQRPELVGAAVVDTVVAQLQRNERGIPENPKIIMTDSRWVDGATVRSA
jgi:LacI family transcriptional regulator